MKKIRSKSKKGFTLVELIVVLVILAILAAMLVPALTGYIRRARQEKDYQFAATVLTAAQSAATYQYSLNPSARTTMGSKSGTPTILQTTQAGGNNSETVETLVGTTSNTSWSCVFKVNSEFVITGGDVEINGATYTWDGATWTVEEAA